MRTVYNPTLFFLVRCTEFRFSACNILALFPFARFGCTFCFLCCCHGPSFFRRLYLL